MLPLALGSAAPNSGGLLVSILRVRFSSAANHRKICFWSRDRRTATIPALLTAAWGYTSPQARMTPVRLLPERRPGPVGGRNGGGLPARSALPSAPQGV